MRAVLQRVKSASVLVDGETVGQIDRGLCVLLGISTTDTMDQADKMVNKLLNVRLWDNADTGKSWSESVKSLNLGLLIVSQFTLYGKLKGNKPDFHDAMKASDSEQLYNHVVQKLRNHLPDRVQTGKFGAMMDVQILNDGPVTLIIDT
ncbi:hypothetical protein MP228_005383 [Amoeboaphelidium protococcarum]|nr:hypothetical protein MP228_005383 [Amoeboaphelidium protococcarum]